MVEEHFGLEADLDEVGDHLHVVSTMRVAVHAQRHEQILSWARQLQRRKEECAVNKTVDNTKQCS